MKMPVNVDWPELSFMDKTYRWNDVWTSLSIGLLLLEALACSPLHSFVEPEVSDLQLTVETLKSSLRDAQRSMTELRAEVEMRSQELADVQVARAQLEGRVRESERRLAEARHVIELQREELADSRAERERGARAGAALQNQLKQLQKQLSKMRQQVPNGPSPATQTAPPVGAPKSLPIRMEREFISKDQVDDFGAIVKQADPMSEVSSVGRRVMMERMSAAPPLSRVLIESGDTLWSIARRHHISVHQLMLINALPNEHIQAGRSLWLTESANDESDDER